MMIGSIAVFSFTLTKYPDRNNLSEKRYIWSQFQVIIPCNGELKVPKMWSSYIALKVNIKEQHINACNKKWKSYTLGKLSSSYFCDSSLCELKWIPSCQSYLFQGISSQQQEIKLSTFEYGVQWAECLSSVHSALGSVPKHSMLAHVCSPNTESGGIRCRNSRSFLIT